ncbi:MAG TPA: SRPBCC domain-containing protein, partial [Acidimicrobiales bacterium]|nr:SRPBCC domain-containing protein [Acidimicrobiales bacterium]
MIDVVHTINAVQRQVGSRVLESGEARTTTVSRTYDAGLDDLWDACTNPERIPRWFLPVSGDLRPGGRYQLEGNAGGTIERCDPPHGFAAT